MSSSLVSSILMYKLRALFSMLVLTAVKQHQLRVLYFLHQLRVLYFLHQLRVLYFLHQLRVLYFLHQLRVLYFLHQLRVLYFLHQLRVLYFLHQLRVLSLYFLHQLRVLYFLFSECGIINLVEKQNCTVHNGTWYNHTCYIVTDGGDHDKYNVNLTSEYMHSALASRKSPSDEYFQYVSSITLLLLLGLVPSSEVAGMVLKSFFHFVLSNTTSSFNPTLSVSLFYYAFIAIK